MLGVSRQGDECLRDVSVCAQPVFVIGAERSGTTALALALGEHPDLWYSCEAHFFVNLFDKIRIDKTYAAGMHRYRWLQEENVSKAEFLEFLGLGINALFTSRSHGRRWIDKTPSNTLVVDMLATMYPEARFIHILRDGRRVVHSMINFLNDETKESRMEKLQGGGGPRWARDFTRACQVWARFVQTAMAFSSAHPDRCCTVRNEELLLQPGEQFESIFATVGIPYHAAPVEFFSAHRINSSFHDGWTTPEPMRRLSDPSEGWTPEERGVFLTNAGATMVKYGLMVPDEVALLLAHAQGVSDAEAAFILAGDVSGTQTTDYKD